MAQFNEGVVWQSDRMTLPAEIRRNAVSAVVIPLASYTLWHLLSWRLVTPTSALEWAALGASLLLGAAFVWRMPWAHPSRGRAVLFYVALGGFVLAAYGLLLRGVLNAL